MNGPAPSEFVPVCPGYQRIGMLVGLLSGSMICLICFTAEFQSLIVGIAFALLGGAAGSWFGHRVGSAVQLKDYHLAENANLLTWTLPFAALIWMFISLATVMLSILFGAVSKFTLLFVPFFLLSSLGIGLVAGLAFAIVFLWHGENTFRSPSTWALGIAIGVCTGLFTAWFWKIPFLAGAWAGILYPLWLIPAAWTNWKHDNRALGLEDWGDNPD